MATNKGFIKDYSGNILLPITRGELILDRNGQIALHSNEFLATVTTYNEDGSVKQQGLPGLMTAAEKAILSGGSNGQSISNLYTQVQDIYTKLGYINSGIKVGDNVLSFYDADNKSTPIGFISAYETLAISKTVNGNNINIDLKEIAVTEPTSGTVLDSISVDDYGRVTAYTKTNNLTGCITTLGENVEDNSIVNKKYVEDRIETINVIATGALTFKGTLSDSNTANGKLNAANLNHYYKAAGTFTITNLENNSVTVVSGDTLIVNKSGDTFYFEHIPSGNDFTYITVTGKNSEGTVVTPVNNQAGSVAFNFSDIFNISGEGSNIANIDLKTASASSAGILTAQDYIIFSQASAKSVSFEPIITSGYEIGKFKYDGQEVSVYGKNYVLSLGDGSTAEFPNNNPVLKLTGNNTEVSAITISGTPGISVNKNGDAIEITPAIEVATGSANYLDITNGYQIGVKIGSNTDKNGLTTYDMVTSLIATYAHAFETVDNSLSSTQESDKYRYGSNDLKTAIDVTI